MRCAIIAILVAIPTALTTWMVSRGIYARAPGEAPLPAAETSAAAAAPPSRDDPDAALRAMFAGPLGDAAVDGELSFYDAQGLFEYIDGAAPIFIERSFRKLAAAELKTESGGEVTCDVYDMTTAEDAASIYDKEQPAKTGALDVGDAGRIAAMAVVFRKGRYYVKLTAFDGPGEKALPAVARALSERIE